MGQALTIPGEFSLAFAAIWLSSQLLVEIKMLAVRGRRLAHCPGP